MNDMTPSHLELAQISHQAYFKDGGFMPNWNKEQHSFKFEQGFAAVIYKHQTRNVMVIAFRGTDTGKLDNFIKNMATNMQLVFGKEPNTLKSALEFVSTTRTQRTALERFCDFIVHRESNELWLTGHSLGGTLAQAVGLSMVRLGKNYQVVTFENPGFGHYLTPEDTKYAAQFKRFLTYVGDPNIINTLHPHIGEVRRIHLKAYSSTFFSKAQYRCKQTIDCVVNDLLRLLLFFLLLYFLAEIFLGKGKSPLFLPKSARYLSSNLERNGYIEPVQFTDALMTLFSFLKSLMFYVLYNLGSEIANTTARQHTLNSFIGHFIAGKGLPDRYSEIESWPTHPQYLASQIKNVPQWPNPNKHASLWPLLWTFDFGKLDEMEEANIQNMDGYRERKLVTI